MELLCQPLGTLLLLIELQQFGVARTGGLQLSGGSHVAAVALRREQLVTLALVDQYPEGGRVVCCGAQVDDVFGVGLCAVLSYMVWIRGVALNIWMAFGTCGLTT